MLMGIIICLTGGKAYYESGALLSHVYAMDPSSQVFTPKNWDELVQYVNDHKDQTELVVEISQDLAAAESKQPLLIANNQKIKLIGDGTVTGFGLDSIDIEQGGSLEVAGPFIKNAQFKVKGQLSLKKGGIKDTNLKGAIVDVQGGQVHIDGGEVIDNNQAMIDSEEEYSVISLNNGKLTVDSGKINHNLGFRYGGAIKSKGDNSEIIINGGEFAKNQAYHPQKLSFGGAIYMEAGKLSINNTASFDENVSELGGTLAVNQSQVTINGGDFKKNNNGDYNGLGGAIFATNHSNIEITGGTFSENKANGKGGAIFTEGQSNIEITGGTFSENKANGKGGVLYVDNCKTIIKGGQFTNNESMDNGGALALAKSDSSSEEYGVSEISAGLFEGNIAHGRFGGGAIYNDENSTLKMMNTLIKENSIDKGYLLGIGVQGKRKLASQQGGGVWNCVTGETTFYVSRGVAIYDNKAPDRFDRNSELYLGAGDDYVNVVKHLDIINDPGLEITSRLLGGGQRIWYPDGSVLDYRVNYDRNDPELLPRFDSNNPGERVQTDTPIYGNVAFKSTPSVDAKALADSLATVRIIGNQVSTGTDFTRLGVSGGGIANNGHLIFGEPGTFKINIEKAWQDLNGNTMDASKIPDEISLKIFVNGYYIESVVLSKANNWQATISDFPNPESIKDFKVTFEESIPGYDLTIGQTTINKEEATITYHLVNQPKTVTYQPTVMKQLNGRALKDNEFNFELIQDGKVIQSAANNESGQVNFEALRFDAPGDYHYQIREVMGHELGITYDTQIFDLKVTVDEDYQVTAEYSSNGNVVESPTFINQTIETPKGLVTLYKVDADSNQPLKGAEFKLVQDKSTIMFYLNDPSGQIGSISGLKVKGKDEFTVESISSNDQSLNRPSLQLEPGNYSLDFSQVSAADGKTYDYSYQTVVDASGLLTGIVISAKEKDQNETSVAEDETTAETTLDASTTSSSESPETTISSEESSHSQADLQQEISDLEMKIQEARELKPIIDKRLVTTESTSGATITSSEGESSTEVVTVEPVYEDVVINQEELDNNERFIQESEAKLENLRQQLNQVTSSSTTSNNPESSMELETTQVDSNNLSDTFTVQVREAEIRSTGDAGEIIYDDLPLGVYHFEEVKAPEGYQLLESNTAAFTIGFGEDAQGKKFYQSVDPIYVKNRKIPVETTTTTVESSETTETTETSETTTTTVESSETTETTETSEMTTTTIESSETTESTDSSETTTSTVESSETTETTESSETTTSTVESGETTETTESSETTTTNGAIESTTTTKHSNSELPKLGEQKEVLLQCIAGLMILLGVCRLIESKEGKN